MLSPITHLPLPQRRTIAARLAIHRAFSSCNVDLDGHRGTKALLRTAQSFADAELERDECASLDGSLKRISTDLDSFTENKPEYKVDPISRELLSSIKLELSAISCHTCVDGREVRPCCNEEHDHIAAADGICLMPFIKLFDVARTTATTYYETYSALYRRSASVKIDFGTAHRGSKPHDAPIEVYLGGKTEFGRHDNHPLSRLKLIFVPDKFDWQAHLAVPYILFHECLCHAFQCAGYSNISREERGGGDRFSEGWMDWVAAQILKISVSSGMFGVLNPDHWRVGEQFCLARGNKDCINKSKDAYHVYIGQYTAEMVYSFIKKILKDERESWICFLNLSLDLNVLNREIPDRYETVQRFHRTLRNDTPEKVRTLEILASFTKHRDVEHLLEELHKMPFP